MFKKIIIFILALFLAAPVTLADDSSIIPVLWLFAAKGMLESQEWNDCVKNVSTIYEYNRSSSYEPPIRTFELTGDTIYEYNRSSSYEPPIRTFELRYDTIYEYNRSSSYEPPIRTFELR